MKKTNILFIVILLLLGGGLTACSKTNQSKTNNKATKPGVVSNKTNKSIDTNNNHNEKDIGLEQEHNEKQELAINSNSEEEKTEKLADSSYYHFSCQESEKIKIDNHDILVSNSYFYQQTRKSVAIIYNSNYLFRGENKAKSENYLVDLTKMSENIELINEKSFYLLCENKLSCISHKTGEDENLINKIPVKFCSSAQMMAGKTDFEIMINNAKNARM